MSKTGMTRPIVPSVRNGADKTMSQRKLRHFRRAVNKQIAPFTNAILLSHRRIAQILSHLRVYIQ